MNYIKHLTGFFDRVVQDHSLNPTHISLYISIFQFWNLNRFQNPISITRDEVMRISKICSKATYHKCMREMHDKGYLKYEPSYNPFRGSMVHLINFSEDLKPLQKKERKSLINKQVDEQVNEQPNEQELNKLQTSIGTGTEQVLVSSINSINNTNNSNILNLGQSQNSKNENEELIGEKEKKEKKLREKKETIPKKKIPPKWNDVIAFFQEKNTPDIEAEKFFNHFQSNGWLVGGKSKMKDWKAAASNWILNTQKFNPITKQMNNSSTPTPGNLQTTIHKNYAEPL
ncbi:transcriptional regulator [Flavobacterium gawalongense]|uniref:Transcriptional regulator n=1 Tax=Flavobacterium gawalongense TaxID=2594432 RepID=A0ABY3CKH3_9FLAO|nr:transcriptional regulator [Flavobacterium gawalongense]TRX01368.1 transcriptional regulator [Flavobacterium gawalongense]TRX05892.1 transcriptional regulator [Flavobacterium gawalongense]